MSARPLILVALVIITFTSFSLVSARTAGETSYPPIPAPTNDADRVVVRQGDHLWKLSAQHLARQFDRAVANSEIAPYWRLTIETNKDRLRSGDPDLIFPGEEVVLPANG